MAEKMSTLRMIIEGLMSGEPLRSKEIAEIIKERFGREVKIQDIASMLSRISNPVRCDLGYFIDKTPAGNGFAYNIVDEFLMLSVDKAYRMTLKGKNRFSPEDAVKEKPELQKYLDRKRTIPSRRKRKNAKIATDQPKTVVPAPAAAKTEETPVDVQPEQGGAEEALSISSLDALVDKLKNINININVSVKFEN